MKAIVFAILVVIFSGALYAAPVCPATSGVFYLDNMSWKPLWQVKTSGVKSSGAAKVAFSYGIASMKIAFTYRDASAPSTIEGPVQLCTRASAEQMRDLVVVRVDVKKDHRELETSKANAYSGLKIEYRQQDLQKAVVSEADGAVTISFSEPLRRGQYIVFPQTSTAMPSGYGGYDFGVK